MKAIISYINNGMHAICEENEAIDIIGFARANSIDSLRFQGIAMNGDARKFALFTGTSELTGPVMVQLFEE